MSVFPTTTKEKNFQNVLFLFNQFFRVLFKNSNQNVNVFYVRFLLKGCIDYANCLFKAWNQCLGYGSGSVGSARFWLPGSGSAKICGSTDPDPRGKISIKNYKKKLFYSKTPNLNFWIKRDYKIFPHFWMVHQVLR